MATRRTTRTRTTRAIDRTTQYARDVVSGRILAGRLVRLACRRHLNDLKTGKARGLWFDRKAAQRVFEFFAELRLPEISPVEAPGAGAFDPLSASAVQGGKAFVLEPSQAFIAGNLFGWKVRDGTRRFRSAYIEQGKGNGKALALDTPIPTPVGWTTMGSLQVGDEVFDEHGVPCRVIGVGPVMHDRPCYRVGFSDRTSIVADARHEWKVASLRTGFQKGPRDHVQRKGGYGIRETEDIARTLLIPPSTSLHPQPKYNHRIDVCGPLQTKDASLPVPPYTFGAWLGDGNSDDSRTTVSYQDHEILEQIRGEGVTVQERPSSNVNTGRYILGSGGRTQACRNVSMQAALRSMGVLGNKHIPRVYLRASESQRMALLQGLMDTDGYVSLAQGSCEFTTTSRLLCDGVIELVRTLGFKPVCGTGRATINGVDCGEKYRILFMSHAHRPVFRLRRKCERMKPKPGTRSLSGGRMIVSCDPVESVPVRCITVDSASHLFLAGSGMIPTHNSPFAAGIGLYGLVADGEPAAEIYSAASTGDQAKILFRDAENMVAVSPELSTYVESHVGNLSVPRTFSFFRPVSAEHKGLDGKRVHMALIDEVHVHHDGNVVEKMRAGTKARRQALVLLITNSGSDKHSVCWHYHELARKVVEGIVENDAFFSYVCQLDACAACMADGKEAPVDGCATCDDWRNPKVWIKANPLLGVTITERYLQEQVTEAVQMPSKENMVKRLNFCLWTEQITRWLPMAKWDACARTVDRAALRGQACMAGLDLASKIDVAACALVFEQPGGRYQVLPKFWVPRERAEERERRDQVPYLLWAQQGLITLTDGNVIDYEVIFQELCALAEEFRIIEIGYDSWNATQIALQLSQHGLTTVDIPQTMRHMGEATKKLESLVVSEKLDHGGHPVLRWMASNVAVVRDGKDNLMPAKDRSTEKIDGIVATIIALSRSIRHEGDGESVYETRGALTVG